MTNMDNAMAPIGFFLGMWTMALLNSGTQGRTDVFVGLLAAPFIAGGLLFLINYFAIKWMRRK